MLECFKVCKLQSGPEGDDVKIFLIGKGVEYEKVSTDKFNTIEQAEKFLNGNGKIYACGTCIKAREQKESNPCPIIR